MTDEVKAEAGSEKAIAASGAELDNLNPGEVGGGNPAPAAPTNKAPEKKGDDEVHGEPVPKPDEKKEEAKPEDKKDDTPDDESWKEQYIQFEDEAGQSVVNLLNEAGVKPIEANSFFAEAIKTQDFTKIKWDLIEARLGKDKAALARIGITHHYETVWKRNDETREKGYEIVGGEENWKKVAAWVKSTEAKDPRQKKVFDEIRKGMDAGGRLAEYAFKDLKALYENDAGNSGLGVHKVTQGDRQNGSPSGAPLSRAAYVQELKDADARGAKAQEIEAIRARRRAGMQAGI